MALAWWRMAAWMGLGLGLGACDDKPAAPAATQSAVDAGVNVEVRAAASIAPVASAASVPTTHDGILDDADKWLALGAPSTVKVIDAGAEPRSVLRYDLPEGAKQSTDMRMAMVFEVRASGNDMPRQKVPELVLRLDLTALSRSAEGVRVEGVISKVSTEPTSDEERKLAAGMSRALASIQGLRVSYLTTPEGRVRDVSIANGKNVDAAALSMVDQLKQSFDSMVVPLPSEPVGVGAVWQAVGRMKAGAEVVQFTRFTLKKKDAGVIELTTELTQLAANRSMSMPGNGVTGTLIEFRSHGSGTLRSDLRKLVPESARAEIAGHVVTSVAGVGTMTVDTTLDLRFAPAR